MKKYLIVTILASALFISINSFYAADISRGDDNHSYNFWVPGYPGNGYSGAYKRSTNDWKIAWKVNFTKSGECYQCASTYWLERTNGINVSPSHVVKEGSGPKYYSTNEKGEAAADRNVHLAAQDNDDEGTGSYSVRGYWDEETGRYP